MRGFKELKEFENQLDDLVNEKYVELKDLFDRIEIFRDHALNKYFETDEQRHMARQLMYIAVFHQDVAELMEIAYDKEFGKV